MASALMTAVRFEHWTYILCFVGYLFPGVSTYAPIITVTCKSVIHLESLNYDAGVLVSNLPERIPTYSREDEYCDMALTYDTTSQLMIYFDYLNLNSEDFTRCETASIELFDGSANQYVTGLNKKICGYWDEMPRGVYFVAKNYFIIRVKSLGSVMGTGFRIHFTRYRIAIPCSRDEFTCQTLGPARCIKNHLVCDDWNDCGDSTDEHQDCNALSAGAIAGIVIGCLVVVGIIIFIIFYCFIIKRRQNRGTAEKDSMPPKEFSRRPEGVSPFAVPSDTTEKKEYTPRYSSGRNSGRFGRPTAPEYEEYPPPYTEKVTLSNYDDDQPRTRRKSRNTEVMPPDEVFDDTDSAPRMRSRSQDERTPDAPREERYAPKRNEPELVKEKHQARPVSSRPISGHHSMDDGDDEPKDSLLPLRKEKGLSIHGDSESDDPKRSNRRSSPDDDRNRQTSRNNRPTSRGDRYPPSRTPDDSFDSIPDDPTRGRRPVRPVTPPMPPPTDDDDKTPYRRGDRHSRPQSRGDRYTPSRGKHNDSYDSDPEEPPRSSRPARAATPPPPKEKFPTTESEPQSHRGERPQSRGDRYMPSRGAPNDSYDSDQDDYRRPVRKDPSTRNEPQSRRDDRPQSRGDRYTPSRREPNESYDSDPDDDRRPPKKEPHTRNEPQSRRDDRPQSRGDRYTPSRRSPDNSFDSRQADQPRGSRPVRPVTPPLPPPPPELADDEETPRRRRRRSRSRESQERAKPARSNDSGDDLPRRSRTNMPPVIPVSMPDDDDDDLPRSSFFQGTSYKEETV